VLAFVSNGLSLDMTLFLPTFKSMNVGLVISDMVGFFLFSSSALEISSLSSCCPIYIKCVFCLFSLPLNIAAVEFPEGASFISVAPILPLLEKSIFFESIFTDFLTLAG